MSFIKLHKLCTYLLAGTGLISMLLSNELHPLTWPVVIVAFLVSWRFDAPDISTNAYKQAWTRGTVAVVLGAVLVGVLGIFPNPILLGAYILVVLMINKLFNRHESVDYLHLSILSFLMLLLGTIVNTDISFAICFVLYVIFVTWSLTLLHLRREIEETYLMRHSEELSEGEKVDVDKILQSKRLVRGSFLLSTSLIALTIFAMSSTLFVLFPRIGFGLFFQRQRSGVQVSGFSNEVRLGSFRRIQVNRRVILRVELPNQEGKPPKRLPYYWRGAGYDFYDGQAWKKSRRYHHLVRLFSPDLFRVDRIPRKYRGNVIRQVIYQEPLNIPMIFGIDRIYNVRLPMSIPAMVRQKVPRIRLDLYSDTMTYRSYGTQNSSIKYTVESVPDRPRPSRVQKSRFERVLKPLFLQLPANLSPKIRELAKQITAKASSAGAKAVAVERYLRQNYKYSLVRKPFSGPPLDDFLFNQKLGHCEFFSTAMTILLRAAGVPARQVTGFLGASWNSYGGYYAVRQSDAHSWVEVWIQDRGWQRFDASPRASPSDLTSYLAALEEYFDSLRLRWYKWVIEYDLVNQIAALKALRDTFSSQSKVTQQVRKSSSRGGRRTWVWVFVVVIVGLLLIGLIARRGQVRKGSVVTYSLVSQLYMRALQLLEAVNIKRSETETPNEYLTRLEAEHPDLAVPMSPLTEVYLALRFDPSAGARYKTEMLTERLAQLKSAIETHSREEKA